MTPQERQLVDDLFDRLAKLENNPRDGDAEDAIADGWDKAPNAAYALVQSVIVQEEALKRANERIQQLEAQLGGGANPPSGGSFLAGARDAMQSGAAGSRGSVPSVQPAAPAPTESKWNTGQTQSRWSTAQPEPQGYGGQGYPGSYPQQSSGGSFLGTAASAAAGVVGGALLMGGIRSLFGGHSAHASAFDPGLSGSGASPWSGSSAADSDLARQAGLNDIGNPGSGGGGGSATDSAGFFSSGNDNSDDGGGDVADSGDFDSGDFGGGGDSTDA